MIPRLMVPFNLCDACLTRSLNFTLTKSFLPLSIATGSRELESRCGFADREQPRFSIVHGNGPRSGP